VHGKCFIFILTTILKSYASFDEGTRSYGPGISLSPPGKIRSPAYNHDLKTIKRCDDFACSQRTSWQTWSGQNCRTLCFW